MISLRTGLPIFLMVATAVTAGEHPACRDVDFSYRSSPPEALREIARSCARPEMAGLYSRRALHAELMADHAVMSRLEQVQRSPADRWTVKENTLFIALVEAVSAACGLPPLQRARVVNTAFDYANEMAELHLRGYDLQAARLRETGIGRR